MDIKAIREIVDLMKASDLSQFEIEEKDLKLCIKREQPGGSPVIMQAPPQQVAAQAPATAQAPASAAQQQNAAETDDGTVTVKSPMVGTFYRSPSPENPPFIEVGQRVKPDTVIGIIEAMKVMNEIQADVSGEVVEILAANEASVEYGQALIKIKPS